MTFGSVDDSLEMDEMAVCQTVPFLVLSHCRPRPKTVPRDEVKTMSLILADFAGLGKLPTNAVAGTEDELG